MDENNKEALIREHIRALDDMRMALKEALAQRDELMQRLAATPLPEEPTSRAFHRKMRHELAARCAALNETIRRNATKTLAHRRAAVQVDKLKELVRYERGEEI